MPDVGELTDEGLKSGASTLDMAPPLGLRVCGRDNLLLLLTICTVRRGSVDGFLYQIRQAGELTEVGASDVGSRQRQSTSDPRFDRRRSAVGDLDLLQTILKMR